MDSMITAAGRALAAGDPLGALNRVALRDDPPALALRGIAMAQLGDFSRAKILLQKAVRAFGPREAIARARCIVAQAEIAVVSRDLRWPARALDAAQATLLAHGDRINAAHARYLSARRLLLIGRIDEAEQTLASLDPSPLPPALRAIHALIVAGVAMRRLRAHAARDALVQAGNDARRAAIPALVAEVESAFAALNAPAARMVSPAGQRLVSLEEVEALLPSGKLVIDACRHAIRVKATTIPLATRPVLFTLAAALGKAWPGDVPRNELIAEAFRARHPDESHRARLRVEIGRLRKLLEGLADVQATNRGFVLVTHGAREVVVLEHPADEKHTAVLALLADGESWSSSGLALALGASQRTVQRALDALAASGRVQAQGRGRSRRWMMPPLPGFTTTLLLPSPLPGD